MINYKGKMKKRIRLNNDKVRKLVHERLKLDGTFVHETKIDKAIQQYLLERQEGLNNDIPMGDEMAFTKSSRNAFRDMVIGLSEIIEDLRIIQTKEPDVLIEVDPQDEYAESYLEDLISNLESAQEAIEFLRDLGNQREEE